MFENHLFGNTEASFSKGKSAVFGEPAEYFPGLAKREEILRGIITAILLTFLLTEETILCLTSPASVLLFLLLQ